MDDRTRDGGTNSTLRTKEQGTYLTLNEHDDDDDDDDDDDLFICNLSGDCFRSLRGMLRLLQNNAL